MHIYIYIHIIYHIYIYRKNDTQFHIDGEDIIVHGKIAPCFANVRGAARGDRGSAESGGRDPSEDCQTAGEKSAMGCHG